MSAIKIEQPGLFTTVQDLGREGSGPLGVSPSGAADALSLRIGNRLVGNPETAAALEMTLIGGTFTFLESATIALAGSDFGAMLQDRDVLPWQSLHVRPNETLRLGPTRSGARCCLCVHGGIAVPPILGSASTHVLSGLGGFDGRPLRPGDILRIAPARRSPFRKRRVSPDAVALFAPRKNLRVTPGLQSSWFSSTSQETFFAGAYRVTEESNRMGLRLSGASIQVSHSQEMVSEGVPLGAVQVPAGGQPIILFVDQQTTGGYPKIANVIAADMHAVGQLRPRDEIRFERVDFATARSLLRQQEALLSSNHLILENG
jgi:antagonist of KipI